MSFARLAPHQERVVAEKADLDDKLKKLTEFFSSLTYAGLGEAECSRLRSQSLFMAGYSAVLGDRIKAF